MSTTGAIGTLSSMGIGSNLDVNGIISKLMSIESQPLTNMQVQQATYNADLSAWGQLNSAFSAFTQSITTATLASTFQAMQASSSNSGAVTANATSTAQAGSHTLNVSTLAQAQTLDSADFADTNSTVVGTGSLTIQFGTFTPANSTNGTPALFTPNANTTAQTITIDSAHDTLQGVETAINAANAGVTASIVNDGTGNRLVITSNNSGVANSLKITAQDSSGNPLTGTAAGQLGQFAYDPTAAAGSGQNLSQTVKPQDATFTLDGIAIDKSTNTVTDALPGVTLNLTGSGTSSVSVTQSTGGVTSAIQDFVSAYNQLWNALTSYTTYNSTSKSAGLLNGNPVAMGMQEALPRVLGSNIAGWNGTLKSLADIGVTLQKDGTLAVNSTTLNNVLQNHFSDVAGIFSTVGSATDSLVNYAGSTPATKPGIYAINVSQLATHGSSVGNQNLSSGAKIAAGFNDSLTVDLDGTTATVTLVPGSYTAAQLASQIQSQINGVSTFKNLGLGVTVSVNASSGLTVTSNSYGSTAKVQLSGDAVTSTDPTYTSLFGTLTETAGTDVGGTINGVAATGQGQYLTDTTSGDAANGLRVEITGGATGSRGTVDYSRGIATQMADFANGVTDPLTGQIINAENSINASLSTLDTQMTQENNYLNMVQSQYTAQFQALDTLLGSMTATSGFLSMQLTSMPWATASTNATKNGG